MHSGLHGLSQLYRVQRRKQLRIGRHTCGLWMLDLHLHLYCDSCRALTHFLVEAQTTSQRRSDRRARKWGSLIHDVEGQSVFPLVQDRPLHALLIPVLFHAPTHSHRGCADNFEVRRVQAAGLPVTALSSQPGVVHLIPAFQVKDQKRLRVFERGCLLVRMHDGLPLRLPRPQRRCVRQGCICGRGWGSSCSSCFCRW